MHRVAFILAAWPTKGFSPAVRKQLCGPAFSRTSTKLGAAADPPTKVVKVTFRTAGTEVVVNAKAGECIANVADRAGVEIVTSCGVGDCGTCEVELVQEVDDGSKYFIKSCVARVPGFKDSITLNVDGDLPPW